MQDILIFDPAVRRLHRDRSCTTLPAHDFLIREAVLRLADRLEHDFTQTFPVALDLGCRRGYGADALKASKKIGTLYQSDVSERMLQHCEGLRAAHDEALLPFSPQSFDLVISALNLHWVNDLPGALIQICQCLKEKGLFLASLFGGQTLNELRHAIIEAESEGNYGASPRISPFTDVKDAGMLLQRAGFALPIADTEVITVKYSNPVALMHDLRYMGESNTLLKRQKHFTQKGLMQRIIEKYTALYADKNGQIPASFEIITLTGWKS